MTQIALNLYFENIFHFAAPFRTYCSSTRSSGCSRSLLIFTTQSLIIPLESFSPLLGISWLDVGRYSYVGISCPCPKYWRLRDWIYLYFQWGLIKPLNDCLVFSPPFALCKLVSILTTINIKLIFKTLPNIVEVHFNVIWLNYKC